MVAGTGGYAVLGGATKTDITSHTDTVHEAVCKMQAAFILHKGGIFSRKNSGTRSNWYLLLSEDGLAIS